MHSEVFAWIEAHGTTVDLLKWLALLLVAWFTGAFSFLRRYRRRPRLEISETASFVFIEQVSTPEGRPDGVRASFIVNAALINASNERVVVDRFELSFKTIGFWRSNRQRLLRLAFPTRPRKQVGTGTKHMSVWFTQYANDDVAMAVVDGRLDAKDTCGGYLLFVSFGYGTWNPRIVDETVGIKLTAKLTSQDTLRKSTRILAVTDPAVVEEFCPGFCAHVSHESTWNHDLSIRKR
jgi:hypothetical protein